MSCRVSYTWHHDFPKLAKEAGFCFNDPSLPGKYDWSSIGSLDVDRIYRERDYASLEYSLQYVLDGPIGSLLESRALDTAVSKLFRVSQLGIQYLLFCKQFLDRSVTIMRDTIQEKQKEIANLKKNIKSKEDQIRKLRQKNIPPVSGTSLAGIIQPLGVEPSCHVCGKTFLNIVYLQAHLQRRHKDEQPVRDSGLNVGQNQIDTKCAIPTSTDAPPLVSDSQLIDIVKLQLEIKQLKDRLALAEKSLIVNERITIPRGASDMGLPTISKQDASVNTDESLDKIITVVGDKYQQEIQDLKVQFNKSIENLKNQTAWMEVSRKMDAQESLWKNRCDAIENKLDQDSKKLMKVLSDIIQSNPESLPNPKINQKKNVKGILKSSKRKSPENSYKENYSNIKITQPRVKSLTLDNKKIKQMYSNIDRIDKKNIEINPQTDANPVKFPPIMLSSTDTNNKTENIDEVTQGVKKNILRKRNSHQNIGEGEKVKVDETIKVESFENDSKEHLNEIVTSSEESFLINEILKTKVSTSDPQKSVSSLRDAFSENADEIKEYRDSFIGALEERMWKLNVDPNSRGLLNADYEKSMKIINHERKLKDKQFAKRGVNLEEVRHQLEKKLDDQLEKRGFFTDIVTKKLRKDNPQIISRRRSSSITPKKGFVKSAMSAFRTKSMEILPNLMKKHDVKKSPTKINKDFGSNNDKTYEGDDIFFNEPHLTSSSKTHNVVSNQLNTPKGDGGMYRDVDNSNSTSDDESIKALEMHINKPMTSTSLERLLASPIKKPEPFDFLSIKPSNASTFESKNEPEAHLAEKKNLQNRSAQSRKTFDVNTEQLSNKGTIVPDIEAEQIKSEPPIGIANLPQEASIYIESMTDESEENKAVNNFNNEFEQKNVVENHFTDQESNKADGVFDFDANVHKILSTPVKNADSDLSSIGSLAIDPQTNDKAIVPKINMEQKVKRVQWAETQQNFFVDNSTTLNLDKIDEMSPIPSTSKQPVPRPRTKTNTDETLSDFSF